MKEIAEGLVTIERYGKNYQGQYKHERGVLTVTAFGSNVEKLQRIAQYSGDPRRRAIELLIVMIDSGRIDPVP